MSLIRSVVTHFGKVDSVLGRVAKKRRLDIHHPRENYFESLVRAIIGQQLSGKAATTIINRFHALFGKNFPSAKQVLKMSESKMRSAGLSGAKVSYVKNLAEAVESKKLHLKKMDDMSDEDVMRELVAIKGIGRWTAEMFLIFTLMREDVFSPGDRGLQNAIRKLYGLKSDPLPKTMERMAKKWSPYRSYACRYLWDSLDNR